MRILYCTSTFQSTLPYGSDLKGNSTEGIIIISPRSLAGATTIELQAQSSLLEFQSTLPYGSDDITLVQIVRTLLISIHAPLRERLIRAAIEKEEEHISILAPSRERHAYVSAGVTSAEFQSSLPRGSDNISTMMGASVMISIHAPLRERHVSRTQDMSRSQFQFTLPCGSDSSARCRR